MAAEERDLAAARNSSSISTISRRPAGRSTSSRTRGDAVQLMTVHAAKGLEFDHVFVLRLTQRGFPMAPRTSVLEFPEALMKEELPKGDFHTQEERRLFYVALTRARERLTLTTVVHKRSKPSVFLDDILSAPQLRAAERASSLTPELRRRPCTPRATPAQRRAISSRGAPASRASIRASANGPSVPAAGLRTAATERLGHRVLPELPAEISVQRGLGHSAAARARRPRSAT